MDTGNGTAGYGRVSIVLHWLMLVLLAAVYACIEARELFEKGSLPRETLKSWHFMLGLLVFLLVWVRLVARLTYRRPPITPAPPRWQQVASTAVHVSLYAFMIGMPLAGWLVLSAAGKPVPFFGLAWPALAGPDRMLASWTKELHETVGEAGYWLIGAHALAALLHHYLRRDDTLRRMLPVRLRSR